MLDESVETSRCVRPLFSRIIALRTASAVTARARFVCTPENGGIELSVDLERSVYCERRGRTVDGFCWI